MFVEVFLGKTRNYRNAPSVPSHSKAKHVDTMIYKVRELLYGDNLDVKKLEQLMEPGSRPAYLPKRFRGCHLRSIEDYVTIYSCYIIFESIELLVFKYNVIM